MEGVLKMNKAGQITKFVKKVFELYDLEELDVFYTLDDYDPFVQVSIPLFPDNKINDNILKRISSYIGLTKEEILNMDKNAAMKYWDKYPFFSLNKEFGRYLQWQSMYKSNSLSEDERILKVIFEIDEDEIVEDRYDYPTVKERMVKKLKEIDKVMPGTFHYDAEITDLTIDTETFISFPQCKEMMNSYFDIINRLKELFFAAINDDLNESDANEFNFLSYRMNMVDIAYSKKTLSYDDVRIYRDIYVKEGYKLDYDDMFSFVRFQGPVTFEPWHCFEFFDDISMAQELVNIWPRAKNDMRRFAMDVGKFFCSFVWSDAKPIMFSPEVEKEVAEFLESIGGKDTPLEERAKERTNIYIDKTSDEMDGWEECLKKLNNAVASVSQGGLKVPIRENPAKIHSDRIMARIDARIKAESGGAK